MDIAIKNLPEAIELVNENPNTYRVISISSPNPKMGSKPDLKNAKEVLYLQFDDVEEKYLPFFADEFTPVTREDCRKALDFLDKGGKCLVHCRAGVSRSTGIVLGFLLKHYPDHILALEKLFAMRPSADPNSYVLKYMYQLLDMEQKYESLLSSVKTVRPNVFIKGKEKKKPKIRPYFL